MSNDLQLIRRLKNARGPTAIPVGALAASLYYTSRKGTPNTRKKLPPLNNESGVMAIMFAVLLIVLMGFAALAVDFAHLLVVRNELQNAADAAALAGAKAFNQPTTPMSTPDWAIAPIWANAETTAANVIQANKSDGVQLQNCAVASGYWNLTQPALGLQSQGIAPTFMDAPAVRVTVSRSAGNNGGPVQNWFARAIGNPTSDISATAVAACASPGTIKSGAPIRTGIFPLAIAKALADQAGTYNGPASTIRIGSTYPAPILQGGQWTSFKDPDRTAVSALMTSSTGTPSDLRVGQSLDESIFIIANPGLYSSLPIPINQDILLPVVNIPLDGSVETRTPIYAFIGFHIVDAPGTYIEGYFLSNFYLGWSGIGGPNYYSAHAHSGLVQ